MTMTPFMMSLAVLLFAVGGVAWMLGKRETGGTFVVSAMCMAVGVPIFDGLVTSFWSTVTKYQGTAAEVAVGAVALLVVVARLRGHGSHEPKLSKKRRVGTGE